MADSDSPIDDFLTRYAATLTDFDARGAANLWATPGMIVDDRSAGVLESRDAMIEGLERSYPLYQRLGLASVGYELLRQEQLSSALTLVRVRWRFDDANGNQLTDSTSYYIVRRDDSGLHACVCIETDAAEKLTALAAERGIDLSQQTPRSDVEPLLSDPSPLGDERVTLRRWSFDDLGCVEEASHDPRIPAGTTVPAVFTPAAGRAFVERQWRRLDEAEGISLAIHDNDVDRAVGLVVMMLRPQPGVIGLGYWVVPSARGGGYATAAATLASTWAIGGGGFARIEAWVEPDNTASQHVLTSAGFELEGRLRSFLATGSTRSDVLVYSRVAV